MQGVHITSLASQLWYVEKGHICLPVQGREDGLGTYLVCGISIEKETTLAKITNLAPILFACHVLLRFLSRIKINTFFND